MSRPVHGLAAEFDTPEALVAALEAAREAGYRRIDALSPFPIREASTVLQVTTWPIPLIGTAAALSGASIQFYLQHWMNVIDYPLNVGGRPMDSWPAFLIGPIIVLVLWGALAAFVSLLLACRLPRLHHPVFAVPGFERASENRFFLLIENGDPLFDRRDTARFLEERRPTAVREVPG